jgi:hypothetical protein
VLFGDAAPSRRLLRDPSFGRDDPDETGRLPGDRWAILVIMPMILLPSNVRAVLAEELDDLRSIVAGLSDAELVRATGCQGWRVADLLVHLRLGAEDPLHGLAAPCEDPADRNYVSCWEDWPARSEVTFSDVRLIWAMAAWYTTANGLRRHFDDVVAIAATASRAARAGHVRLHGHVQTTEDFVAMWAVEFCVHHLDLLVGVPDRPGPTAGCCRARPRHGRRAPWGASTPGEVGRAHVPA